MTTPANSVNEATTGIVGFTGTAWTATSVTQYNVQVGNTSSTLTQVAPSATSGVPLVSAGAAANPAFGTAVVAGGGTGATTLTGVLTGNGTSPITANAVTQHGVLFGGASNAVSSTAVGTSGQILTSNGPGLDPTFEDPAAGGVTSVSGTADRITSTGGATPVIDIAGTYVGQTSLTTLGTVTTGTWNATDIAVADGGTGRSSATEYAVICGGTTSTGAHQSIAGVGSAGEVLTSNGAGALPTFQAAGGGGDYTLISTATASSSASISFTDLSSTYHKYVIDISNLQPVTDDVLMQIRTSTNNGSSYDSGASDYGWVVLVNEFISTSALTDTGDDADTRIGTFLPSGNLMGNAANEISSYTIELMNPSAATYFQLYFHGVVTNMDGLRYNVSGAGSRLTAADVDAIQFTMSTGNISTGTFKLYGISAS